MNLSEDRKYIPNTLNLETVYGSDGKGQTSPVRLAIIGAGSMGAEHIQMAYTTGGGEVSCIVDPNPGSIEFAMRSIPEPQRNRVKIYSSLAEAGKDESVEAMIIATPNHTHIDVVLEAMKYEKHILLEKPMAHTRAAAQAIYDAGINYSKILHVGLEYRYKPLYKELIYEVKERRSLGDVRMISILEHRVAFLEKWHQWNKFARYSGGTLVEKCCHYFDLFNLFAGSVPVRVFASGGMNVNFKDFEYNGEKSDIIDGAFTIVEYENGTRACLNLCMFLPSGSLEEVRINGSKASLYGAEKNGNSYEIIGGINDLNRSVNVSAQGPAASSNHNGSTYYEHIKFYREIRDNVKPEVSILDGLWAVAVGAAAEESIKTGMPVDIKGLPQLNTGSKQK